MKLLSVATLSVFTILLFTVGFMPIMNQSVLAAVTSVTINEPLSDTSFGMDFATAYVITDSGSNTSSTGSITYTRTGGSPDAGSHVYTMLPFDTSTGIHTISRTTLEGDGGFDFLVDGTVYTIDISIMDGITFSDQELNVTADFTAPTFSAAKTAPNQITLTWTENVDSILNSASAGNPFTLGNTTLTVTGTSSLDGTGNIQVLTLSGIIEDGSNITVSYDKDAGNGDITDAVTYSPNPAPDINNVNVFGISENNSNSGGKCDGDCEEPTLGVDARGKRMVSNGFTYNEMPVDVERFFTPYPLITVNVGEENRADFKIYDNMGPEKIKHFSFAFGLGKNQVISQSKAMIELDIDFTGKETVTLTDPEKVLGDVKVETSQVSCNGDGGANCLGVSIFHTFRAPLDFNIVATDVWDTKRNAWQNYFNHGIEVVGQSLNPTKEYDGINKGQTYHLIETSKTTAVDEFGNSWTLKYDVWNMDYVMPVIQDSGDLRNRNHSAFSNWKQMQAEMATSYFDSSKIQSELSESFAYEYPTISHREQTLQKLPWYNEE